MTDLHSEYYKQQLMLLHKNSVFGNLQSIPLDIKDLIIKYQVKSILDFGCGKGYLVDSLKNEFDYIDCYGYDPTHSKYDTIPQNNLDMIISFDVLEHIEPDTIDNVLSLLHKKCNKVMHHLIACHPSKRHLSDGRNAHLIVESPKWWRDQFQYTGWNIVNEKTVEYTATPKKGNAIDIIKYFITLEKWDN